MEQSINVKLLATEVGDLIKWDTSIPLIKRTATAIFPFQCDSFPSDGITSERARLVYNWIMTCAAKCPKSEATELIQRFCRGIVPSEHRDTLEEMLSRNLGLCDEQALLRESFDQREFHPQVHLHSKKLFCQGNFFHAVFEACKVYNKAVRLKAVSEKDGEALMLAVWGPDSGCLKITPCQTETDKNVQDGVKFLSAGLMRAVRNPTAHEPAIDWPIKKQDCLDLLGFVSFLFRQLDVAVYIDAGVKRP